jgi:hypothetical protein
MQNTQGFPYILQGNNLTVVIGAKTHTIAKSHLTYEKVIEAIKAGEWDKVKDLIEPKQMIIQYGMGNISIQGEVLTYKGRVVHNALSIRMISMIKEGFNIEPMVNFMENLMVNPSYRAATELYGFLEKCNLPITPDGYFLAYKKVRDNYMDCHTGTMDNSVGKIVEMDRNMVNDDKDQTCSAGLHFCSESYLSSFGGERIVIVKINPADVVSIPSDYNDAKGRACKYEVVGEIENESKSITAAFSKPVQANANGNIAPVTKTGSSPFFDGYTTGYTDGTSGNLHDRKNSYATHSDQVKFEEGYDKGHEDGEYGEVPKYQFNGYVSKAYRHPVGVQGNVMETRSSWPQPKQ